MPAYQRLFLGRPGRGLDGTASIAHFAGTANYVVVETYGSVDDRDGPTVRIDKGEWQRIGRVAGWLPKEVA